MVSKLASRLWGFICFQFAWPLGSFFQPVRLILAYKTTNPNLIVYKMAFSLPAPVSTHVKYLKLLVQLFLNFHLHAKSFGELHAPIKGNRNTNYCSNTTEVTHHCKRGWDGVMCKWEYWPFSPAIMVVFTGFLLLFWDRNLLVWKNVGEAEKNVGELK